MDVKRIIDLLPHFSEMSDRSDVLSAKINGEWHSIGIETFREKADLISYGLLQLGILPGDRVAIISNNCPEWNFVDFGISQIGAVSVPIYPTMSNADTAFIINDAEVKIACVGDADLYRKIETIRSEIPSLEHVFSFKQAAGQAHLQELIEKGKENQVPQKLNEYKAAIQPDDLLTLIYTSGTTGTPKGVMLTHHNLISNVVASGEVCPVTSEHKILSFLPLSHIFERMLVYLYLYVGAGIYYAESMETIGDNLKEVKPFCFSTVPRLLEKVYDKIVAKGTELTGVKRKLFFWALDLGHRYELDGANGWFYELQLALANKLIFNKWRDALGGNVGVIVSGAAALQPRLARVFTAAQIPVLEGYGLTETSPVICVNRLAKGMRKFGSVGPPIRDVQVKIADDGEVLCKGPNVMKGYYKRPDFTAEVLKDGWLYTGDIGKLENGLLLITDRKKEIFKTSGGKYIAPQVMENKFKESTFIEQIMVVGEGKKHPSALIVPAFTALIAWAKENGITELSPASLCSNPKVIDRIQQEVDNYNAGFGHYEMIKKFILLPTEWAIASGELTPKLSLKRRIILEKFTPQIDALYAE
jgi:long-chain acyl-CoA synthetase